MFDVIYADPPWDFKTWSDKGKGRSPEKYYQVMTLDDIRALPVSDLAGKDAALFLWVTFPFLYEAKSIIEKWGFKYTTQAFTWAKTTPNGVYKLINIIRGLIDNTVDVFDADQFLGENLFHLGTGYYTRANAEVCLLGIKGKMRVADRGVRSLVVAPVAKHSAKPKEVYKRIERLYPDRRYLELFARNTRSGWVSLGNEIDGKDIREALKILIEEKESKNGQTNN